MVTASVSVGLIVARQRAVDAFARAHALDVERGGIFDARSAAINVWSHPWTSDEHRAASEPIGTIYVSWHTPDADHVTLRTLEIDDRERRADLWQAVRFLFDLAPTVPAPWEREGQHL